MRVFTNLCDRKCSYAAGNDFMRVWTNLCDRKCSNVAGNDFMQVQTNLCDRKYSHATGNNFMRVWTDLCNRKWSWAAGTKLMQLTVGKNSILNFSRQILNRNVQSPSSASTVMTHHSAQPKPVWKKAPPGLQRPSRIATPSGWPSITPRYLTHTLDPALKAAGARVFVTIRLLKKDLCNSKCS